MDFGFKNYRRFFLTSLFNWEKIFLVTGETLIDREPKGQIPRNCDETLRQKDCNLIKSWKDHAL